MIIDIIIIVLAIIAIVIGWRKGLIVQLLQLIGLYAAILFASDCADSVGEYFTSDPRIRYLVGFAVIVIGTFIFVWIIAPLFRKLLFFDILKRLDSLLGLSLALVATFIVTSVGCSLFESVNIGEMRPDKVLELGAQGLNHDNIEEYAEMLESRDSRLRDYFEPNYIAYETLDESKFFNTMAAFGESICPELKDIQEDILEWAITVKSNYGSDN